jgi:uncharacterized protein YaeQ
VGHRQRLRLSDVDRGVYQTLAIRAVRHPSEAEDYLVTRVLPSGGLFEAATTGSMQPFTFV